MTKIKQNQDCTGNYNNNFKTLGTSYHTNEVREDHYYYATIPHRLKIY